MRAPKPSARSRPWLPAVVVLAGIAAYFGSFRGVFLLDDVRAIVEDRSIRRLATALSSPAGAEFMAARCLKTRSSASRRSWRRPDSRLKSPDQLLGLMEENPLRGHAGVEHCPEK